MRSGTITKADITTFVTNNIGITKKQAWDVVESLVHLINRYDRTYVHGLGTFHKVKLPAKEITMAFKGSKISVPERTKLRFKQSRQR